MSLEDNNMQIEEKEKKDEYTLPKGGMKIYYSN